MSLEVSLKHSVPKLAADFSCEPGQVTALWGPSGAGKSTVAKILAGLVHPDFADVSLNSRHLIKTEHRLSVPAHKRRMGYVGQSPHLFPHLTAEQNLLYGFHRNQTHAPLDVENMINRLALRSFLKQKPHTLSGGQKQRIALGRAFLQCPDALILDEPLTGLDAQLKQSVLSCLEETMSRQNIPVLYISHMTDEVVRIADTLVCIDAGHITWSGKVADNAAAGRPSDWQHVNILTADYLGDRNNTGIHYVSVDDQHIPVSSLDTPKGTAVRIRINSDAIMLANNIDSGSVSANTILSGTITRLERTLGSENITVTVALGTQVLNTQVTQHTVNRMNLKVGVTIQAVCKTTNVRLIWQGD